MAAQMVVEQSASLMWYSKNSSGYSGRKPDLDPLSWSFHLITAHGGRGTPQSKISDRQGLGTWSQILPIGAMSGESSHRSSKDQMCPTSKPALVTAGHLVSMSPGEKQQ